MEAVTEVATETAEAETEATAEAETAAGTEDQGTNSDSHIVLNTVIFRAGEPANILAAPAPDVFYQAAPAPGIFFRSAPTPRGQKKPTIG